MRDKFARFHNGLAHLVFAGAILQVALISMAYFGAIDLGFHAFGGLIIEFFALLMLISALVVRASRSNILFSLLLFLLLFPTQPLLAYTEDLPAVLRGLHGLNGMLIMGLAYSLARGKFKATNYQAKEKAEPMSSEQVPEAPAA
jgi:hypothetical protein